MLSVVIPTRNRSTTLASTLEAIAAQVAPPGGFEVVVADDGSTDGTAEEVSAFAPRAPVRVELVTQDARGPAAARNAGVHAARGDLVLFLGDDTEPADQHLIAAHAELHAARPEEEYAVLGRIDWSPSREVTPLMAWLHESGLQFDYASLEAGPIAPDRHLYSSHVSVKRGMLERAGGFDERFRAAALEDLELGARLEDAGLVLDYRPELVVYHDHPVALEGSLARMRVVGRAAALYHELHPERLDEPLGPRWAIGRAVAPALRLAVRLPIRGPALWRATHLIEYARGYREGLRAERRRGR